MELSFSTVIGIGVDIAIVLWLLYIGVKSFCGWYQRRKWVAMKNKEFENAHTVMVRQTCANCRHCRKTWMPGMHGRRGHMAPSYCTRFHKGVYGNTVCYAPLLEEIEWRILK